MNRRARLISLVLAGLWLGRPLSAEAHRIDEYLQATRISIERDRVSVEIGLTAGVSVAPLVFSWIDTNHDGRISAIEGEAYARQVFRSIELSVDGQPVSVTLVDRQFPEFREMSLGVGVIRLHATAKVTAAGDGRHQVLYRNTHRAEWSVYLANVLVPDDNRIEILGQRRDPAQRELAVDYRVISGAQRAATFGGLSRALQ